LEGPLLFSLFRLRHQHVDAGRPSAGFLLQTAMLGEQPSHPFRFRFYGGILAKRVKKAFFVRSGALDKPDITKEMLNAVRNGFESIWKDPGRGFQADPSVFPPEIQAGMQMLHQYAHRLCPCRILRNGGPGKVGKVRKWCGLGHAGQRS